jgi:hypothetical protein
MTKSFPFLQNNPSDKWKRFLAKHQRSRKEPLRKKRCPHPDGPVDKVGEELRVNEVEAEDEVEDAEEGSFQTLVRRTSLPLPRRNQNKERRRLSPISKMNKLRKTTKTKLKNPRQLLDRKLHVFRLFGVTEVVPVVLKG